MGSSFFSSSLSVSTGVIAITWQPRCCANFKADLALVLEPPMLSEACTSKAAAPAREHHKRIQHRNRTLAFKPSVSIMMTLCSEPTGWSLCCIDKALTVPVYRQPSPAHQRLMEPKSAPLLRSETSP